MNITNLSKRVKVELGKAAQADEMQGMREQMAKVREYAKRIDEAVSAAGIDPLMLDYLPATYVAAALALKVRSKPCIYCLQMDCEHRA